MILILIKLEEPFPNEAINDSWQGIIPAELQAFTHEFDGPLKRFGLTIIELSMICIYNPITFLKMLPSGTCFSLLLFH